MNRTAQLAARVTATNRANQKANELHAALTEVFRPLVGQKILKANGDVLASTGPAYLAILEDFRKSVQVYRDQSNFSLRWAVKTSENIIGEQSCIYADASCTIGNMNLHVLESITPAPQYRTDYSAEEIQRLRDAYEAAKRVADDALSALYPFGESDR